MVMQADQKIVVKSALWWLITLTVWYPGKVKLQQLSELAAALLQHDQQKRPSANALLEALQTISAQA